MEPRNTSGVSTVKGTFGLEAQFVRLGPRSFSPEGVVNLRRRKGDSVKVGVGGGDTTPSEIKSLECAIEVEVPLPVTEGLFACPILLESRRLDMVEPSVAGLQEPELAGAEP